MASSEDRTEHTCPSCRRMVRLRDPGMPSVVSSFTPSPILDPFQPLPDLREEDKGWEQDSAGVVIDMAETPRERAHRTHPNRLPAVHPDRVAWLAKLSASMQEVATDPIVSARRSMAQVQRAQTRRINLATAARGEACRIGRARVERERGAA